MTDKRVCVIGLDGVNRQILDLINLDTEDGKTVCTDMLSTIPPYTPPAWTSILSGVDPGKHSVHGFYKIKDYKLDLTNSFDVRYPRLFELLDLNELKSIVINVPLTYPFEGMRSLKNTIIVTDWACPVQEIYPKNLLEKYKEFLVNPPNWNPETGEQVEYSEGYLTDVHEYLKTRLRLYYDLLENYDWNLFFIVFSETDWLLHRIPELLEGRSVDEVRPIFDELRKFFKKAVEVSDLVLVVSDHGFEINNKKVSINSALLQSGLLRLDYTIKKPGAYSKHWLNQSSDKPAKSPFFNNILKNCFKMVPKGPIKFFMRKTGIRLSTSLDIDYSSDAVMYEHGNWTVKVNRNPDAVLKELNSMDGVKTVIPLKELYGCEGGNSDLVLIPEKGVVFSVNYVEDVYGETYRADHGMYGVFMATGDDISNNQEINTLSVCDVTPTILAFLDLPIPENMEGRVVNEIFNQNSVYARRKPNYVDSSYYRKEFARIREVKNVLKGLKMP